MENATQSCQTFLFVSRQDIPSLGVFDVFGRRLCGSYCVASCENGFPFRVLWEWATCLTQPSRAAVNANASNVFIQVGGRGRGLGRGGQPWV